MQLSCQKPYNFLLKATILYNKNTKPHKIIPDPLIRSVNWPITDHTDYSKGHCCLLLHTV